jgi:phosphoribosyl 1,2-cyclic phosphodiesterase
MRVKFWGVRGSTPTPEYRNSRYGGNTTCLEVRLGNGTLIILDCGSGLRALGKSLAREFGEQPIHGYVFLTHFHWDHIQGVPFFIPLYGKSNIFMFHAVKRKEDELKQMIEGQMVSPYFPVDMTVLASARSFYDLDFGAIDVHGAVISSAPLNHPQESVAYRIEADEGTFVLATDTEPGSPLHDRALRELAQGADVLVYDAQYTPEQLQSEKKGWGHSSWLEGVRIARECGVSRLILFHHDPDNDDRFVDGLVERARQEFPNVEGAAEGLEINLSQGETNRAYQGPIPRREPRYQIELPLRAVWKHPQGGTAEAEGVLRNISNSGVYFLAPTSIYTDQTVELEGILPDAITGRGSLPFHYTVQPIRRQPPNGAANRKGPCIGVAALRINSAKSSWHKE